MANYKELSKNVYVEQNIYSNTEIESYEAKMDFFGVEKTTILYYYKNGEANLYSLGILENLSLETINIVQDDMTDILKFKSAKNRRKHIYQLIEQNEENLEQVK